MVMPAWGWRLVAALVVLGLGALLSACLARPLRPAAATAAPTAVARAWPATTSSDYAAHPAAADFFRRMEEQGFARAEVAAILAQARRQPAVLELIARAAHPERPYPTGAWLRYRAKFITPTNITRGVSFWRQHAPWLRRAEQRFGVPSAYVVAILGIETRWGGYLGEYRVIDALTTLAFDYPRRAPFFTAELEQYLIMAREEGFDPLVPTGSYAGAMGLGQFMPSSFRRYAVDFNDDGVRDLWNSADAIGSVANYCASFGWRAGQPVAQQVTPTRPLPDTLATGFATRYRPAHLRALGLTPIPSAGALETAEREDEIALLRLDVGAGYEYWLGFVNFAVITRYNPNTHYAMAVHQLAETLAAARGPDES